MPTSSSDLQNDVLAPQAPVQSPAEKLAMVLLAIGEDSQIEPSSYLDETLVPFGGE